MYTRRPTGYPPPPRKGRNVGGILLVLVVFVAVIFLVDTFILHSDKVQTSNGSAVLRHLDRNDVKRVTIAASALTLELNDGTTLRAAPPEQRDLWPAVRKSGADIAIVRASGSETTNSPLGIAATVVPFGLMAILLLVVLRRTQRSSRSSFR